MYTFPMNGNYGADPERDESGKAHARAIIAREITNYRYNRASCATWLDWLAEHGVLAVGGVDTRALTRHLREKGALRAVVSTETTDVKHLCKAAQGLPRMSGLDLAKVVTCEASFESGNVPLLLETFRRDVLREKSAARRTNAKGMIGVNEVTLSEAWSVSVSSLPPASRRTMRHGFSMIEMEPDWLV